MRFFRRRKKKDALYWVVVVFLSASTAIFTWRGIAEMPFPETPLYVVLPSHMARLTVDFGSGSKREFRGEVPPETSALDALSYATSAGNIAIEYAQGTHGTTVRRIGEKYNLARGKQWRLYLNGQRIQDDPMTYPVNPQDVIEWKYE